MGSGQSYKAYVRVQNDFGCDLDRVTVSHKFKTDGAVYDKTWHDVSTGTTTNNNFTVYYKADFGAWTDYDWWKVVFRTKSGKTYYSTPYWEGEGFKQCYLKEEDSNRTVTIKIKSYRTDGIIISPARSADASCNWVRTNEESAWKGLTRFGAIVGNSTWTVAQSTTMVAANPGAYILNEIVTPKATYGNSEIVFKIHKNGVRIDTLSDNDKNDYIYNYRTRKCRILHGSISWVASTVSTIATGMTVDHWWVTIETYNGIYYNLQFEASDAGTGTIVLRKCESSKKSDMCGLTEASKDTKADIWQDTHYSHTYSSKHCQIKHVIDWLNSNTVDKRYNWLHNNSQHLCKAFDNSLELQL